MFEALQVAGRHGGVKLQLFVLWFRFGFFAVGFLRRQRFVHTRAAFVGCGFALGTWQELGQQFVGHIGVAEIGVKQFAEHQAVLLAADHHGFHGGRDILLLGQADSLCCFYCQRNARSIYSYPGAAQGAAKTGDVVRQLSRPRVT